MATSLAQQLKRLAAPQTTLLVQDKTRASLLFTPRDAANLDRETVYEIGLKGFQSLCEFNSDFLNYQNTLFDESSKQLERSIITKSANEKLDAKIHTFLALLSPYFTQRPAHEALEWLINRFYIHQFNKHDFLLCILPHHETRIFARALQLLDLRNPTDTWHWLYPLQKPGSILPRSVLLTYCGRNLHILKLICAGIEEVIKANKSNTNALHTIVAFYTTTIVGVLERCKTVSLDMVTFVVSQLRDSLKKNKYGRDFVSGNYLILGQLSAKVQLDKNVTMGLISKLFYIPYPGLEMQQATLLLAIFQTQRLSELTTKALNLVLKAPHIARCLAKLGQNYSVMSLLRAFVKGLVKEKSEKFSGSEVVILDLIQEIKLNHVDATSLTKFTLELCVGETSVNISTSICKQILQLLSNQYPAAFDSITNDVLNTKNYTVPQILQEITCLVPNGDEGGLGTLTVNIHHANEKIRASAVKSLVAMDGHPGVTEQFIIESLAARFRDDDHSVGEAVLDIDINKLISYFGIDGLVDNLAWLLNKERNRRGVWLDCKTKAIEMITSEELKFSQSLPRRMKVLGVLLPYFFPATINEILLVHTIGGSSYARNSDVLKALISGIPTKMEMVESDIAFSVLGNCHDVLQKLGPEEFSLLMKYFLTFLDDTKNTTQQFCSLFFLSCLICETKQSTEQYELSHSILSRVLEMMKTKKVKVVVDLEGEFSTLNAKNINKCFDRLRHGDFPLQCALVIIHELMLGNPCPAVLKTKQWWNLSPNSSNMYLYFWLMIKVFSFLMEGSTQIGDAQVLYQKLLKKFMEVQFPNIELQLYFLSMIWSSQLVDCSSDFSFVITPMLQLSALNISSVLLKSTTQKVAWTLSLQQPIVPGLLVALGSTYASIRTAALQCLNAFKMSMGAHLVMDSYHPFVEELLLHNVELEMDEKYLPMKMHHILDVLLQKKNLGASKVKQLENIKKNLIVHVIADETPMYVRAGLLTALQSINSMDILKLMLPLGVQLLNGAEMKSLRSDESLVLKYILCRFTSQTCNLLDTKEGWSFFSTYTSNVNVALELPGLQTKSQTVLLQQVTKEFFNALETDSLKQKVLLHLTAVAVETKDPAIASLIFKIMKHLSIDANIIVNELGKLDEVAKRLSNVPQKRSWRKTPLAVTYTSTIVETKEWKQIIVILEMLQNKKKIKSPVLLVQPLFQLLQKCLTVEDEVIVQYMVQLSLSCIQHCLEKSVKCDGVVIDEHIFQVELIIDCIRNSQSPQTHHQALLLLSMAASMFPDQVLRNIMPIFTFVGSSMLQKEDVFSFQVISRTLETIIPVLIQAAPSKETTKAFKAKELEVTITQVMSVFIDALLDVPEHRRIMVFDKLLKTVDPDKRLWLLWLLIIESYSSKQTSKTVKNTDACTELEFALRVGGEYEPVVQIRNCIQVIKYWQRLPLSYVPASMLNKKSSYRGKPIGNDALFDVKNHTHEEIRHYAQSCSQFVSSVLSAPAFIGQLVELGCGGSEILSPLYQEVIQETLSCIQQLNQMASSHPDDKYYSIALKSTYDILEKVNKLLPTNLFVKVVNGLLGHHLPAVRRKALEMLNVKLGVECQYEADDMELMLSTLLPMLLNTCKGIVNDKQGQETVVNQQLAFFSLKWLCRIAAPDHPAAFKGIISELAEFLDNKSTTAELQISVFICLSEFCCQIKSEAIPLIPKFMPVIVKALQECQKDAYLAYILKSIRKIVECLLHFLSPYVMDILYEICCLSMRHVPNAQMAITRIGQIMATELPSRMLIPAVSKTFDALVEQEKLAAIEPLTHILKESYTVMSKEDFTCHHSALTKFFVKAFDIRADHPQVDTETVSVCEGHVIAATVTLIPKLSESIFKPMLHVFYNWVAGENEEPNQDRAITFYRFCAELSKRLKNMFVIFSSDILKYGVELLKENNSISNKTKSKKKAGKSSVLVLYILDVLEQIFLYDTEAGVTKSNFDTILNPLVDQIENVTGTEEDITTRADSLAKCLSQFAVAVSSENLLKSFNYQVLLKTRDSSPTVRLTAIACLEAIMKKLGSDSTALLTDTVSFVHELLEDDEPEVELATQKFSATLQEVTGEDLQSYFSK